MEKQIQITINGKKIICQKGQTILEIAKKNKIEIPHLCYHPDLKANASCRLCLVKIKGENELKTACSTFAENGMEITTDNEKIANVRKTNLELLWGEHCKECEDCVYEHNCELKKLSEKLGADSKRYSKRKAHYVNIEFGPAINYQRSKCIDCQNCVEACHNQTIDYLEIHEYGHLFRVEPTTDETKTCIYCGQCVVHCPVGAFEGVGEFEEINKALADKSKTIIFQFAPSIRTSIAEEFRDFSGVDFTEKLVAAIKKLGVHYVYDTSVGADFTTTEESKECIKKISKIEKTRSNQPNNNQLIMTSCCPSWVRFVEFYYPEFVKNLATTRSPQVILGGLLKTYWIKNLSRVNPREKNINPKDIYVVSVMPCLAKKYEITLDELKIDGLKPVDLVLSTRELAYLFFKNKIDLLKIKPQKLDDPFETPTGAGIVYGVSGGVMDSALRSVEDKIGEKINFKIISQEKGLKIAEVVIKSQKHRLAVVDGIAKAREVLEKQKKEPGYFSFIEVMACPGGCIGGGGQPVPQNEEIRKKRAQGLIGIDQKQEIRIAHKNPIVEKVYKEFLTDDKTIKKICHRKFKN